jgi:hypothetical protein
MTINEALKMHSKDEIVYEDIIITKEFFKLGIIFTDFWSDSKYNELISMKENLLREKIWEHVLYKVIYVN